MMTTTEPDLRQVSERIDGLITQFALADEESAEKVQDLVRLLMQLYGAGLSRALAVVREADPGLVERIADDQLVASLLVLHDLHPIDLGTRMERALDRVRPYLGSHGGDVEILGLDGDVVRVRMGGSCDGCPSSSVTLVSAIEKAIMDAAPEVSRVEAEVPSEVAGQAQLIQLQPLHARTVDAPPITNGSTDWLDAPPLDPFSDGPESIHLGGISIIICRSEDELYAYRDACASCGASLRGGQLANRVLSCPGCGARYDVRLAGRSADGGPHHLEPLPLLSEQGAVRICVPTNGH